MRIATITITEIQATQIIELINRADTKGAGRINGGREGCYRQRPERN